MKIPLFDIDWTVLGKDKTRNIHNEAFYYSFKEVYKVVNPKTSIWEGKIDNQIILETVIMNGVPEKDAKQKLPLAIQAMRDYFIKHRNKGKFIVLPGVRELLIELHKRGVTVGLLTGNVDTLGWGKLEKASVKNFFQFGAFGNEVMKRVELIALAHSRVEKLLRKKIQLKSLVIIGDTPLDITCAKEGGIESIGVASGPEYTKVDLEKAGANLVISSFLEKEKVIDFLS